STKKGSINYVLIFYKAMIIFAKKHFSKKNANLFSAVIQFAIYFRALLSIVKRFFKKSFIPVLDAALIYMFFWLILPYWEHYKFHGESYYPDFFMEIVVPIYILIWIISIFLNGGYRKPIRLWKVARGILVGTIAILVIYALLPLSLRFSRALILFGAGWTLLTAIITRLALSSMGINEFRLNSNKKKRIIIIGKRKEAKRVHSLIEQIQIKKEIIGYVFPGGQEIPPDFIGNINQLEEILKINKINEIIFCAKDISSQGIISHMLEFSDYQVEYKIAPQESLSIIGSNSINTAGDLYVINFNSVAKNYNRNKKRFFDIMLSILFLLFIPVLFFFVNKKKSFFGNIFKVLCGKKSWVGYIKTKETLSNHLPPLRSGVLNPLDGLNGKKVGDDHTLDTLNLLYSKDYKLFNDIDIILKGIRNLGRQ
ncbi:MAG: glycosyl transferase family 2, partial [bacterium]